MIKVEKIIPGGQALGTHPDGRKIFFWNALPGETVTDYEITKKNCPRPLVGDDINEYYKVSGNQKWQEFKLHISEIVSKTHEWDAEYRENVK